MLELLIFGGGLIAGLAISFVAEGHISGRLAGRSCASIQRPLLPSSDIQVTVDQGAVDQGAVDQCAMDADNAGNEQRSMDDAPAEAEMATVEYTGVNIELAGYSRALKSESRFDVGSLGRPKSQWAALKIIVPTAAPPQKTSSSSMMASMPMLNEVLGRLLAKAGICSHIGRRS